MGIKRFSLVLVVMMINAMLLLEGCLEEERIALLQMKSSFDYPNGTSFKQSFWGKYANCCNWEGVSCEATTGRVVKIDLTLNRFVELGDWYLNATLFLPFQKLNSLSLHGNNILGCVENEGFERLSKLGNLESLDLGGDQLRKLSNLEKLDLGDNRFNNSILSSLKGLSSLKYLDLSYNQLKRSFDMKELDALINLEEVNLNGNEIDKFVFPKDSRGFRNLRFIFLHNMNTNGRSIPFSLLQSLAKFPSLIGLSLGGKNFDGTILAQALPSLKNLEELEVYDSTLNNSILQTIGRITTLKSLYLYHCGLNGTIPTAQGLCELKHLQTLVLRHNHLTGALPWCLSNLTSLQSLHVSSNHFTGDISSSPLISLTSLQDLYLSDNYFQIPISLNPFFNHSKLNYFYGDNNEIYAEELEEHNLAPKFQLEGLSLSSHGHGGAFPKFLFYQFNLMTIDFSNLKLRGGFPNWLLDNNTNLQALYLANNSLSGSFQLPTHPHVNLLVLDISHNYFNRHIPTEIGAYFPSLYFLSMSGNDFTGSIPSSFGMMLQLHVLDLSTNNISGTLSSCFSSLPLVHVYLSHNTLQGHLEDAFRNSTELITLDLSRNRLTGSIPEWIVENSQLSFLLLGNNNLEGRIPLQLCKLDKLSFIDLSHNNFSGHILPCLRFRISVWFIQQLGIYSKLLDMKEPLEITTKSISYSYSPSVLKYMSGMDLSSNNLEGNIPQEIGNLNYIHALNLSNNHLIGRIPQTFSNLSQVESLDLSNNHLNRTIPPQLVELHSLAFFSVAHNNLSGKTPEMIAQFSTFTKNSYEDNPLLCGPPLPKNCTDKEAPSSPPKTSTVDKEESDFIDTSVFCVSVVVTYIMVLLGIVVVLYINPNWRRAWFYFIEESINKWYYFLMDHLLKPFGIRAWKPLV